MDGILNIYKEKGFTSHDVVAKLRGILKQKKIGHTGTLDPDAEGVLPVCLGKGTKVCSLLTDKDKVYEAVLLLGKSTDTQDISGVVTEERPIENLKENTVTEAVLSFIGEYEQVPPMYSALKVNGKKLYELAREGIEVERKSRKVQIHHIHIKEITLPRVKIEVACSKGTYIRTLCHDIGEMLGCGGCMEALLRTKVDIFELSDSLKLEKVKELQDGQMLQNYILPVKEMFRHLPEVIIKEECQMLAYNGNIFYEEQVKRISPKIKDNVIANNVLVNNVVVNNVVVCDEAGHFIGIFQYKETEKLYKPVKCFWKE